MRLIFVMICLWTTCLCLATTVTVTGKVVGPSGMPVPGARVIANLYTSDGNVEGRTDQSGKFSLSIQNFTRRRRHAQLGFITAYSSGYALSGGTLPKLTGNVIHIGKVGAISGKVTDARGKPVAGVAVRLRCVLLKNAADDCVWIPDTMRKVFTVITNHNGVWTLAGVPLKGGVAIMRLDDPRYISELQTIPLEPTSAHPLTMIARPVGFYSGGIHLV